MEKTKIKRSVHGNLRHIDNYYVNKFGTYVEQDYNSLPFVIEYDEELRKFIVENDSRVYVDDLVIRAFGKAPKFSCVGKYLNHKDGDLSNCEYDNLEWKEVDINTLTKAECVYFDKAIVYKDGRIYFKKGMDGDWGIFKSSIYDRVFHFSWPYEIPKIFTILGDIIIYDIHSLMERAGYIAGDISSLKKPAILHKDNNVENFSSDNLEWCEETDPRYIEFSKIIFQRQKDLFVKLNKGSIVPDFMKAWFNL